MTALLCSAKSGGRNGVPFGNDRLLFLDICSKQGAIYAYSPSNKTTTTFEPQPPDCNAQSILTLANGTLTLFHFPSNYTNQLTGISQFEPETNAWKRFGVVSETPILCANHPIIATDDANAFYLLDTNDHPYPLSWQIKVLQKIGDEFRQIDCINVDFIQEESRFDALPQPRPLIPDVVVVNLPFDDPELDRKGLVIVFTGSKCRSIDDAPLHRLAVFDLEARTWQTHDLRPRSLKARAKAGASPDPSKVNEEGYPNFSVFSLPNILYANDSLWYCMIGHSTQVWQLPLNSSDKKFTWKLTSSYHPNLIACCGISKCGIISADCEKIYLCLKHAPDKGITATSIPLGLGMAVESEESEADDD